MTGSVPPDYFDALFRRDADPWRFASSAYEQAKQDDTLAALGGRHFPAAFEPGCANGVLTARLAPFCGHLLAADGSAVALDLARVRCAALAQVDLQRLVIPAQWPVRSFDLIVLSEVLYFLTPEAVGRTATLAAASLRPGGLAVLVNWLGNTAAPCSGSAAADRFIAEAGLPVSAAWRRPGYRLDVLMQP